MLVSQVDKIWSIVPIFYAFKVSWTRVITRDWAWCLCWCLDLGSTTYLQLFQKGRVSLDSMERGRRISLACFKTKNRAWIRLGDGVFFNLFFICLYQNTLYLFTLPTIVAWQGDNALNWLDIIAAIGMFTFIIIETIADQQQYNFQTTKHQFY